LPGKKDSQYNEAPSSQPWSPNSKRDSQGLSAAGSAAIRKKWLDQDSWNYFGIVRHSLSSELNQSGICWLEAAFVEIELTQVIFKVYVEPLAPSLASFSDRHRNNFGCYAVPLSLRRYNRVQNERVNPAIPEDIHKSDEHVIEICAHPSKAMPVHLRPQSSLK
jgi:hypothetical protein